MTQRWIRIAPHLINTLLLGSGVALAIAWRISPLAAPWLAIKLVLILGYIICGILAFRATSVARGRTRATLALTLIAGAAGMAIFKPI